MQTKVYYNVFTLSEKKGLANLQKNVAAKNFLSNVRIIGTTFFDECLLLQVVTGIAFTKIFLCPEDFLAAILLQSLTQVF